jgi:hypothetical protein
VRASGRSVPVTTAGIAGGWHVPELAINKIESSSWRCDRARDTTRSDRGRGKPKQLKVSVRPISGPIRRKEMVDERSGGGHAQIDGAAAPASAQTYDPRYPVCMTITEWGGPRIECSFTSIPQCGALSSGRAAQCYNNPYYGYDRKKIR